ncbi:MAG: phosphoesterase, partial [Terriglobales bacterium]
MVKKVFVASAIALSAAIVIMVAARAANQRSRVIHLPTSKELTLPVPGFIARTNSFPATIAMSPDGRYAALLNQGYGTIESGARQSIAILDLNTNQLRDFPDDRLIADTTSTRQSYFIGLAFSSDGKHLYASMGSITDATGEQPTSTGNGIAEYKVADGQVTPERFIKIPPQPVADGKVVAYGVRKTPAGTAPPYPAGFAVLPGSNGDRLLIADNLSDNVVLLDVVSGQVLKSFDLSRNKYVPSVFPYTVISNKAATKAWVSMWNGSSIAELDLQTNKVTRWIKLYQDSDPARSSSHPTT